MSTVVRESETVNETAPGVELAIADLTIRAGRRTLLDRVSARFQPGAIVLIVGCSGVGKSLLLKTLAGLIDDQQGEVEVSGNVVLDGQIVSRRARAGKVGVVFQQFALFDELSPAANVRLAQAHGRGRQSAGQALELLDELGVPADVHTAALSGGQRQRLAIARTLAYDPDVVLYDEPTSGLDPATAVDVARLIRQTHATHPKTSLVVTHDIETLREVADQVFVLDPRARTLREVPQAEWGSVHELMSPLPANSEEPATRAGRGEASAEYDDNARDDEASDASRRTGNRPTGRRRSHLGERSWRGLLAGGGAAAADFLLATTRLAERVVTLPWQLLPLWKSPAWGTRFLAHYARLVAGPSAWLYIALAGAIVGFVTTYFTFRFLPFPGYTAPLLIEDLLKSMGFALYRILMPILATILIAARCGAAVASDVGSKTYGHQADALVTLGARPNRYLLTNILYAFLIGTPLLVFLGYLAAAATSLAVFIATHPEQGPDFWQLHFHSRLAVPDQLLFRGTAWVLAKTLVCAAGIALIAHDQGAQPKRSSADISRGITGTVLWSTLFVLVVHFVFAFLEF